MNKTLLTSEQALNSNFEANFRGINLPLVRRSLAKLQRRWNVYRNGLIFSILIISSSLGVLAQDMTKSPYSALGLGDLQFGGNALLSSLGQTCQGVRRGTDINTQNPASYGQLKYTVVEAAYKYTTVNVQSNAGSNLVDNYSFGYLNVGLPLSPKHQWGICFGLQPYSSMGYNVSANITMPTFPATLQTSGRGGLSRFFLGTGFALFRDLSFGCNVSYLWGQLSTIKTIIIPPDYNMFNIQQTSTTYVGDVYLDYGLQYHHQFVDKNKKPTYKVVIGSTVNLASSLHATQDFLAQSFGVGSTQSPRDTVVYTTGAPGTLKLPLVTRFGFSLESYERWMICGDVNLGNWSTYQLFNSVDSLKNMHGFSLGATYIPAKPDEIAPYYKKIELRAGARYDNGYLTAYGHDISTYGISVGAGFPIARFKSKLNITAEYFVRGTTSDNLIQENNFRVILGITFNDRWFDRYKYH